ncbi:esterase family protein [Rhodocaloribacter sp.]
MRREIQSWWSPRLDKEMEIVAYGHYGFAVLLFPTAAADFLEYERFQMIDALAPLIESGTCKVYSINSINRESWLNDEMHPRHKAIRHQQYNGYVAEEVVPFIFNDCNGPVPIITSGASLGALHALNTLFRRPDLFAGTIAMSGVYDLKTYTKGYWDEDVYFNSPADYVPNLTDEHILGQLRQKRIIIASGQGAYENPDASKHFSWILHTKGIPHELDLWGHDMPHDWPTWRKMLPYFLSKI